ncbi:MAG: polysaccharide biosynthesis protein [Oscillospiraceae bacterium]|nr:polysaccharide biosynthesis protein [Oscillospiraceae bacterium]
MNKRKILLQLLDIALIIGVAILTAVLFPQFSSVGLLAENLALKIAALVLCLMVSRIALRLYSNMWRYANVKVYLRMIVADAVGYVLFVVLGRLAPQLNPGFAYASVCACAVMLSMLLSRFVYQLIHANTNAHKELPNGGRNRINIAIIGAGNVGCALAEELLRNPLSSYNPIFMVDNDRNKVGRVVHGLRVHAENEQTMELLRNMPVQEIVIAIPDADAEAKMALYERYRATGHPVKIYDYLSSDSGSGEKGTLRDFNIEDLLFRGSIKFESEATKHFYADKVVLVTGGGGSIGSELCRQIAKQKPKKLIIFDIYENNAYEIQQELRSKYGGELDLNVIIGSVRDAARMESIFASFRPQIVVHAAAHKHVPLMESSPAEAFKNNVLGTYNTANMAEKYEVEKFLLISTDKAVNPTNIMGASKRLCEMLIQCRTDSKTVFSAVRFGNVLGSNGSVIPLFRRQIAAGGPVTLTDKRVIRYFMTIPEAVQLVLEAGAMAKSGELFVLDMGKPVKILDLAEKLIRLSGYVPYRDIDIVEIGMRPGEKLYEELLIAGEDLSRTENELIFIERDAPCSRQEMEEKLQILQSAADVGKEQMVEAFRKTVPTYHAPVWEEPRIGEWKFGK